MGTEIIGKAYEPRDTEDKWYQYWEKNGLFKAREGDGNDSFCIVIPPPNVTGTLHIGHALDNTLQDILIRYKRMQGINTLWQPGTDHAGIATQNVVERDLADKGTNRHAVGREKFIDLVWEWRKKYGGLILNQLRRLGCSCDWSRERFTMDEGLSRAVREVFVTLYEEGLIYRGDYIINWCPRCHTALADLEVEHREVEGHLYHLRYLFESGKGHVTIATTRPETLLGDTAVAVNPEDERYKGLAGRRLILPVLHRPIPLISDDYVDTTFGTGALKITPAHDPNDFEIGKTHELEIINVIDENGIMTEQAGPYQGMDRFECRRKILDDLQQADLVEKIETYQHAVGHCYRCKTVIEPLISKQWFVKVAPLAEKASQAVKDGRTKIFPSNWESVYFDWMSNIKDWCVSRQIWWGHRIPAWYCQDCQEVIVARETPQSCGSCSGTRMVQETDVLDTWFSSALWPFSTLGWPEETKELTTFYPTSVLVTGFDILFFWVARMMMMGLHFMGDVPFKEVYIHALVRDGEGKKMSKSKGNVIDPLEIMDRFGTDAFRFTLAALAAQGRDIKLSEERIVGYRNFVNKIWNAARLILMNLDGEPETDDDKRVYTLADKWIVTRLSQVSEEAAQALDAYQFNEAAGTCYQFVWHEFCDWYLEMVKLSLYGEDEILRESSRATMLETFKAALKLLHPFMPFVTEEIWQKLPGTDQSIMISPFPKASDTQTDEAALADMELLIGIITGIRNIRGEMNIGPGKKVDVLVDVSSEKEAAVLRDNMDHIKTLAKAGEVTLASGAEKPKASATAVFGQNQIHVLLKGLLDFEEEKKRLSKKIKKIEKEVGISRNKLANKGFLKKAPPEVVEEVRGKAKALSLKLEKLEKNLQFFEVIND